MLDAEYDLVETLHTAAEIVVTRRRRRADGAAVIVKALRNPDNVHRQTRLQYEYGMLQKLQQAQVANVMRPVAWVHEARETALVAEDMGGYSLRVLHGQAPLQLPEILQLAPRLCTALSGMHRANITHKDVNPSNIVCVRESLQVQLIDFEIASQLSHESQETAGFNGTPAYASPEQTGRMNRSVDWRTDLYSLGVSLYELLAHQLPFTGELTQLVHAILAREAEPLEQVNPACPPQLAQIVRRLMAKATEDRYQSAQGAHDDLLRCWEAWQQHGRIDAFELGQTDRSERFELSETLYGRAAHVAALEAAYGRAAKGHCEVLWLAGPSGIGKSALVGEVQRMAAAHEHSAVVLAGKYDQLRRHVPFNAFTLAVAALMRRVLLAPQAEVDAWRLLLGGALGNIGQALVDIAPSLSPLLGPQKPLHDGGPQVTENRFILALQRFLIALSTRQPLVLFLDDLQWADSGTFKLLKTLLTSKCGQAGLLLIGAYRDNEVHSTHPLRALLDMGSTAEAQTTLLQIEPLGREDLTAMVMEATHAPRASALPLAQDVLDKTGGNPFFVREFLLALARKQLFTYDPSTRAWRWDTQAVRAANVTDNMATLMSERLRGLTAPVQQALSFAAALGNEFSLHHLALVLQSNPVQVAELLATPMQLGLLVALGANYRYAAQSEQEVTYKFAHDQIQQAAYKLLTPQDAARCHHQIAQRLLATHDMANVSTWVMSMLEHLQRAAPLLSEQERVQAIELNYLGAMEAKKSAAYSIAVDCLRHTVQLMGGDEAWQQQRDFTWRVHLELAMCCFLMNDTEGAQRANALALKWAQSPLETAQAYRTQCEALSSMGNTHAAIEAGLLGLRTLGMHFTTDSGLLGVVLALVRLQTAMLGKRVEDLPTLPPTQDPRIQEIMALLTTVALPVFFLNPLLFARMSLVRARLSIQHGTTASTPHAFAMVAVAYTAVGNYPLARRYAQAAMETVTRLPLVENGPSVTAVYHLFCNHTRESPAAVSDACHANALLTLEAGSRSEAWPIIMSGIMLDVMIAPLACREHADHYGKIMPVSGGQERVWLATTHAAPRCLLGETPSLLVWWDTAADQAFEAFLRTGEAAQATSGYVCTRTCTQWLGRDLAGAVRYALWGHELLALERMGDQTCAMFAVWALVVLLDHAAHAGGALASPSLKRGAWRKLRAVAKDGPEIYGGVVLWINAMQAVVDRRQARAGALFQLATAALARCGYACFVAAAHECAARFYAACGNHGPMRGHLLMALEAYETWGARAKLAQLRHEFSALLSAASHHATITLSEAITADQLDLGAILELAQALGDETSEDNLVHHVIETLVAQAGATRGIFVSCTRDGLQVVHDSAPDAAGMPRQLFELVRRGREAVVMDTPAQSSDLHSDAYIAQSQPGAVLCAPVRRQGVVLALIYLENRLTPHAFTPGHLILVQVLAAQAALALQSARLYSNLEGEVAARTTELQAVHAKLVGLEKSATETHLAGGFAHEMRNALNPASIAMAALSTDPEYSPKQALQIVEATLPHAPRELAPTLALIHDALQLTVESLASVHVGVQRALHITQQILEFASVGGLHAGDEHVSAPQLVQQVRDAFDARLQRESVAWHVQVPSDMFLAVKQEHLYTVLRNLVANACDALETAGNDRRIDVHAERHEGSVRIRVSDTGAGMTKQVQSRVFEPFFSTKGARGTGLGLGLCRRLMQLYGGSLHIESVAERGTTVTLHLPEPHKL